MTRALVTGAAGFAGSHLRTHLHSMGWDLCTFTRGAVQGPGRHFKGDLRDSGAVERAVSESRADVVFHLGAMSDLGSCARDPGQARAVNVEGTRNIIGSILRFSPESVLLLVSSVHVYGAPIELPLREDHPRRPLGPYAESKRDAEDLLFDAAGRGLRGLVVRAFQHTGPGQDERFALSSWARQIALGHRELRVGRLDLRRDYSDVRDIVRGYCLLANRAHVGHAVNLCSGRALEMRELLRMLLSESASRYSVAPELVREGEPPLLVGDPSRARSLGWEASTSLEQTLRDLLGYWMTCA